MPSATGLSAAAAVAVTASTAASGRKVRQFASREHASVNSSSATISSTKALMDAALWIASAALSGSSGSPTSKTPETTNAAPASISRAGTAPVMPNQSSADRRRHPRAVHATPVP